MQKNTNANTKTDYFKDKKYIFAGSALIILIIILIFFGLGYRLGGDYLIGKIGTLTMTVPYKETSIYIDEKDKVVTSKDGQKIEVKLTPTIHSIIVSLKGYQPWVKLVEISNGGEKTLFPIFVPINTSGVIITTKDQDYTKIKNSVLADKLPTKTNPRISKDGLTTVWVENNAVLAKKGDTTNIVIVPETPIRNVDFYKDRSDSLLLSLKTSVYVIEILKDGTQNFIPVYNGISPNFIKNSDNSIYILDGTSLMQVGI